MDDLSTLLEGAAGAPRTPVDGAAIRARVERRRRVRTAFIATVVLVAVAVPLTGLVTGGTEDVRLEQGPPEPVPPATATAGPIADQPSYGTEMEVAASIDGPLAAEVTVTGLSLRDAREGGVSLVGDAAVIVTSRTALEVALDEASSDRGVTAAVIRIDGTEVIDDRQATRLPADTPTLVILQVEAASEPIDPGPPRSVPFTDELTITIPIRAADGGLTDLITMDLTPRELTAADLDVPEPADIPDQDLPRPAAGEALPEQLDDGTPVWVVGLDDDVVVLGARSTHSASGLVGWCGTLPGFIDSPGASRFDSRGHYRFGPAATGLVPYDIDVHPDRITVLGRLAAPPRPPQPSAAPFEEEFPPIAASALDQGVLCRSDADRAREEGLAYEEGREDLFAEDYTESPSWVQHDPSHWPAYGGQDDGWFHTESIEFDGLRWTGALLIRRENGHTVDIISPPGAAMAVPSTAPDPTVRLLMAVDGGPSDACPTCTDGSVAHHGVAWLTPDQILRIEPGDTIPPPPVALTTQLPFNPAPSHVSALAPGATIDASPGDLVLIHHEEGQVTAVTPLQR